LIRKKGKIKSRKLEMSEESRTPKETLPEYQQFAHLKPNFIGMREAARKYKVPVTTLHTWVKKGAILIESKPQKYKRLVNEADVAYCAYVYHRKKKNKKSSRSPTFNADGTPFKPKSQNMLER